MSGETAVSVEVDGGVAVITINRGRESLRAEYAMEEQITMPR